MRSSVSRWSVLGLALVMMLGSAGAASAVEDKGFGITKTSSEVAITNHTFFVLCPKVPVLVLHPDYTAQTQSRLGARILSNGDWKLRDGRTVTPQEASYVIDDGSTSPWSQSLPVIAEKDVDRDEDDECDEGLVGWKCVSDRDCDENCLDYSEVGSRLWSNGPGAFCACDHTGDEDDTCVQTAGSVTCTWQDFSEAGCTGTVLFTGSATFPDCE